MEAGLKIPDIFPIFYEKTRIYWYFANIFKFHNNSWQSWHKVEHMSMNLEKIRQYLICWKFLDIDHKDKVVCLNV